MISSDLKKINSLMLFLSLLGLPYLCSSQTKKKADPEADEWRYEIEAEGVGTQGTYQVKVWSYSSEPETITELAKKNAVHGIIFKGFADKNRVKGQKSLAPGPDLEQEKSVFFTDFFKTNGKYLEFVTLANDGALAPEDRIKIGKKQYKIALVLSVNVAALRKYLEDSAIIKGLSSGF
jgi:hypothetical protein